MQRTRSSFENLRSVEENQDPSGTASGNRSPYDNEPRNRHRLHHGNAVSESI